MVVVVVVVVVMVVLLLVVMVVVVVVLVVLVVLLVLLGVKGFTRARMWPRACVCAHARVQVLARTASVGISSIFVPDM